MPCDSVRLVSCEMAKANEMIMSKAISNVGSYDSYFSQGRLYCRSEGEIKAVKREYAKLSVQAQAKRYGWRFNQVNDDTFEVYR